MATTAYTVEFRDGAKQSIEAEFVDTNDHVLTLMTVIRLDGIPHPAAVAAFPRESVRGIYPKTPTAGYRKITIEAPLKDHVEKQVAQTFAQRAITEPEGSRVVHMSPRELRECLEEAREVGRAEGFDTGWAALHRQLELQRANPKHPITRENPYKG